MLDIKMTHIQYKISSLVCICLCSLVFDRFILLWSVSLLVIMRRNLNAILKMHWNPKRQVRKKICCYKSDTNCQGFMRKIFPFFYLTVKQVMKRFCQVDKNKIKICCQNQFSVIFFSCECRWEMFSKRFYFSFQDHFSSVCLCDTHLGHKREK